MRKDDMNLVAKGAVENMLDSEPDTGNVPESGGRDESICGREEENERRAMPEDDWKWRDKKRKHSENL